MFLRQEKRNNNRVKPKIQTHARILSATKNATVITLTFDVPVLVRGTPAYTTDVAGVTAVSAEATSLTTVEVTFSASIAAATELNIPPIDEAIRTKVGGFVADTYFPLT